MSKQITTVLHKPKTDVAVLEKNNQWMPADELVVLEVVESISHETVRKTLKKTA